MALANQNGICKYLPVLCREGLLTMQSQGSCPCGRADVMETLCTVPTQPEQGCLEGGPLSETSAPGVPFQGGGRA